MPLDDIEKRNQARIEWAAAYEEEKKYVDQLIVEAREAKRKKREAARR